MQAICRAALAGDHVIATLYRERDTQVYINPSSTDVQVCTTGSVEFQLVLIDQLHKADAFD